MPTPRRLLLLALLLPQLAALSVGQALVVCVGDGDHLEVELASSACCQEPAGGTAAPPAATLPAPSGSPQCPSCEDIDLLVEPTRPDRETLAAPLVPPGLGQPALPAPPCRTDALSPRRGGSRASPPNAHLRTVVLRC